MLCMVTTSVVGFSRPKFQAKAITLISTAPVKAVPLDPSLLKQMHVPAIRPSSLAKSADLDTVLGQVSSRRWSKPFTYSPDRAIADLRNVRTSFHGVGFPEVRTYSKPGRHGHALGQWSQMISWRTSKAKPTIAEPIAHVHCMGLSPQAVANRADRYDQLILKFAMEFEISASLIKAVITEESCFNNKALSPVGAQGLMQLMPETADWLKVRDPHDPTDNIRAGVRYLASLRKQFDSLELALAAYNAGPGNVRKYGGIPPFVETQAYVQSVQAHYRRYVAAIRFAIR